MPGGNAVRTALPLTADSRLRIVLISTISAPQASSWPVISSNSASGTSGDSNSAEPPPEMRNSTQSSSCRPRVSSSAACAARSPASSGTGCPASKMRSGPIGPRLWSYLVMTAPDVMRGPSTAHAAFAMAHAAFPMAMSTTRPEQEKLCSARATAASGCTARRLARMI